LAGASPDEAFENYWAAGRFSITTVLALLLLF
jgi:hypothetical protein